MTEHRRQVSSSSSSNSSESEPRQTKPKPSTIPTINRDNNSLHDEEQVVVVPDRGSVNDAVGATAQCDSEATVFSSTNTIEADEEIAVRPHADTIVEEPDIVVHPDPDGYHVSDDDPEIAVLPETNPGAESTTEPPPSGDDQRSFPDAFFCPLTGQLMNDPVVVPTGQSYERKNILTVQEESGEEVTFYPNRALKSIIEREVEHKQGDDELPSGALKNTLKHLDETIRSVSDRFFDNNSNRSLSAEGTQQQQKHRSLPDAFFCPITLDLIRRPVIEPDGYTYEQKAILQWIRQHGTSPNTRQPLSQDQLFPNLAIQQLIDEEMAKPDELMHPAVKAWKENPPPLMDDDGELVVNSNDDLEAANHSMNYPMTLSRPPVHVPLAYSQQQRQHDNRMRAFQLFLMLLLFGIAVFFLLFFPSIIASILCMALVLHYGNRALQHYASSGNQNYQEDTRAAHHPF